MEVFFCDRCSARVTEGDLAEGRAFQIHTFVLCKACWDNSEVREAIERRIAEASGVMKIPQAVRQAADSGRHAGRRKTPRPTSGRRRTPARGTPRRTPLPHGRRRTPGRTSPVNLERVPREQGRRHDTMSRRRPDAPAPSGLPKLILLAIVGLCLGLMAFLFLGAKEDPDVKRPSGNYRGGTSESGTKADLPETGVVPPGTDPAATNPEIDDSGGLSLQPGPGTGIMGALRSGSGFRPEFDPGVAENMKTAPTRDGAPVRPAAGATEVGGTTQGLVAHWKFDEGPGSATAVDAAGKHNGRISDPGTMSGHAGRIGRAYRFVAQERHNHVDAGAALLKGVKEYTLTGWVNPASVPQPGKPGLWGQDDNCEFGFWGGDIVWWTENGNDRIEVAYPYPANQWHHIALVAKQKMKMIYFDGQESVWNEGFDGACDDGGHSFKIGGGGIWDEAAPGWFDGRIDDVRVYGRALTSEEVKALCESR